MISVVLTLLFSTAFVHAGHYKGGTITWKPVDPYTNSSSVEIIIIQSHSWTLSRFLCNQATITGRGTYTDGGGAHTGEPNIQCQSAAATCTSSGYVTINQVTFCTDFSTSVQTSSGSLIKRMTVARSTNIIVGFTSSAWATEIRMANGVTASTWSVMTKIDLTQTYPLNSSPVTGSLPLIRVIESTTAVIQIPAADWDTTNDVRCRWALASGPAGNECGDVCANIPGANLSASDCTITWYVVRRPVDITASRTTSSYLAALMVEDFVSTSSSTPLSSVPLQMIIYTYQRATGSCTTVPAVIGDRPNRACIGVPIGVLLVERIVATVYCSGDSIVEFLTTTPLFVNKTILAPVSGTVNQWFITLSWVPTADQRGPQVFCAAPIDQRGLTGSQHCINFVVGFAAPNLITPILVQGSASPLGTVLSNHSLFSIQATGGVNRPTRNGTYVRIFNRANPYTAEWERDCGYSPDCIYTGTTVIFRVQNANWTFGGYYYILLDSGAASGNVFCSPESSPILDPAFWTFDIWNPGLSSTTTSTTTTTAPTVPTATTRPPLTTTPVPNMTTVGIVVTTTTAGLTTSTTTIVTTSTVTTLTVTTGTVATTTAGVAVMTAKDFETQCQQPVAIMTAVGMVAMLPINVVSMFTMFTKVNKMFNPQHMAHMARKKNVW